MRFSFSPSLCHCGITLQALSIHNLSSSLKKDGRVEVGKMRERDKNCLFFNRTVNLFGLGVKGHLHGDALVITVRL